MTDAARLFVAVDLPPAVVDALVAWRESAIAAADGALRPVAPESLHVTLCFLGERPEAAIAPLSALVEACAGPAAGLALGAALWLPRARPRVLAVALDDRHGELGALQVRVMTALDADGWHEPDPRPYLPHVTVARVRGDGRAAAAARRLEDPPPLAFDGAALALYRSHLTSDGAGYVAQTRVVLA